MLPMRTGTDSPRMLKGKNGSIARANSAIRLDEKLEIDEMSLEANIEDGREQSIRFVLFFQD
jgi:hypothetical protein